MIALLFSTEQEAEPFLERYQRGRLSGIPQGEHAEDGHVLVAITGVGKIKATLRTERLLRSISRPEMIIHAGTCTALNPDLKNGELVAATQVFEGDRIELSAPTYPRMPVATKFEGLTTGTLVTQDHQVRSSEEQSYWQRIADVSDMEAYAIAYVAAMYGVPVHVLKAVAGHISREEPNFRRVLQEAQTKLADHLLKVVNGK